MKFQTKAIHAGQPADEKTGAVIPPIYQNVTFVMDEPGVKRADYDYLRTVNPTRTALEACLAELEGASRAVCFASGMAATGAITGILKPGDHAIASLHIYAGTHRYFSKVLNEYGIRFSFVETEDAAKVAAAIEEDTRLIWVETPGNPLGTISDIRAISEAAKALEEPPLVVVDSTMASPYCQQPLSLGADAVVHSTTKYISGHLDVLGGVVATNNQQLGTRLFEYQNETGPTPSPFDNWLTLRGVRTLGIRMKAHQENAAKVAEYLENHPKIEWVSYPGLPSHPQHETAKRQMSGFSGMVAACVKGGYEPTARFLKSLRIISLAESLGGVQSLVSHSATMTHAPLSSEEKIEQGITEGVIRLSVGLEDVEDIIADLEQSLSGI